MPLETTTFGDNLFALSPLALVPKKQVFGITLQVSNSGYIFKTSTVKLCKRASSFCEDVGAQWLLGRGDRYRLLNFVTHHHHNTMGDWLVVLNSPFDSKGEPRS
jgi:hypothetical protein